MKTLTIQIGNSDNKLTQVRWSEYVAEVRDLVEFHSEEVHFSGGSENWQPWQNVSWVVVVNEDVHLLSDLSITRKKYNQDSVAITKGQTEFV